MLPGKTAEMPAMHGADRQRLQTPQTAGVILQIRVVGVFDQRPVVDDVAAEQRFGGRFIQADTAWRMPRRVQHLQRAIAQIEYIAVDPNPTGLTSYTYPVDLFAVVQDTIGTAEAFTGLTLSDLPAGTTLSVVRADGSYQEITPNAQGEYDLSAYTALLNTPTTTAANGTTANMLV